MENQNIPVETDPETEGMTLQDTQLLAEIGEIGRLSDEINQSLTEIQLRLQLDASASMTEQTENGGDTGVRQNPPTHKITIRFLMQTTDCSCTEILSDKDRK